MPSVHPPRTFADYFSADYEPPTPMWRAARKAELYVHKERPVITKLVLPGALCRGADRDDNPWYPDKEKHGSNTAKTYRALVTHAKETCAICPASQPCLEWALEHGEVGIWGGTTDTERRLMRKPAAS